MNMHAIVLSVLVGVLAVGAQDEPQVYCGRRLSTVLGMLCENGLIKRSETTFGALNEHAFPWITARHARSLGRSKRQVVSECCFKPCTIEELLSYCA